MPFGTLKRQAADPLLALIGLHRDDVRADKIDLGVGVYREDDGRTPVMRAVKAAERQLVEQQETKAYLGSDGDLGFVERLVPICFGVNDFGARLVGLQTPGGTGALRLAAELLAKRQAGARILLGTPSWPIHAPIFAGAGLEVLPHPYFNAATGRVQFDAILAAVAEAQAGDAILLQGCCHNPTGADLVPGEWDTLAAALAARGIIPLLDLAYQGLAGGLDVDAQGCRRVLDATGAGLLAYSCDKNFGLYRERTGALFALAARPEQAGVLRSNLLALARANWSMPPDHGAAVVRMILEDAALEADWRSELDAMRARLQQVRDALAAAHPLLETIATQRGMFSMLPIGAAVIERLREQDAIYMAGSGRINVAGLNDGSITRFACALSDALDAR